MAMKAVTDAVEDRLGTTWTSTGGTAFPVYTPNNASQTRGDGAPFLTVEYPIANSDQVSIGAPGAQLWREEGAIRLVLAVPSGEGTDLGRICADELAALFRGKQFAHVTTFAPTSPVADESNNDGVYYKLAFVVPYQFDFIG